MMGFGLRSAWSICCICGFGQPTEPLLTIFLLCGRVRAREQIRTRRGLLRTHPRSSCCVVSLALSDLSDRIWGWFAVMCHSQGSQGFVRLLAGIHRESWRQPTGRPQLASLMEHNEGA